MLYNHSVEARNVSWPLKRLIWPLILKFCFLGQEIKGAPTGGRDTFSLPVIRFRRILGKNTIKYPGGD